MAHECLLSIIIPVYNVEKYIKRAIDSITCQSFSDYEIIICDDGSEDNSGKICDELAASNERITVIHKENGGVSSARNKAFEIAVGKYVYFLDPDDYLMGEVFAENILLAEQHDCDQVVFSFESEVCDSNDRVLKRVKYSHGLSGIRDSVKFREEYLSHIQNVNNVVWNRIYKKSSLGEIRFSEAVKTAEDAVFNLQLVKQGIGRVYYNDKIYYSYMCRINSLMNKYNPYRFDNEILIIDMLREIIDMWDMREKFNKYISWRYVEAMLFEYGNLNMRDCRLTLKEMSQKMRSHNENDRVMEAKKQIKVGDISHISLKVLYFLSDKNMFLSALVFKRLYTFLSRTAHMILYILSRKSKPLS